MSSWGAASAQGCSSTAYFDNHIDRIGANAQVNDCRAADVLVAIIDSGIQRGLAPEASPGVLRPWGADFAIDPPCKCLPGGPAACDCGLVDSKTHGMTMAGVVAGKTHGVDKLAQLISIRVYGEPGPKVDTKAIVAALKHAADAGADVVLLALEVAIFEEVEAIQRQLQFDSDQYLAIWSAGNENIDLAGKPEMPQKWNEENLLVVSGTNGCGCFSGNYGGNSQILAPSWDTPVYNGCSRGGTSLAAALVAGVASKFLRCASGQILPMKPKDLKNRIVGSACLSGLLAKCDDCGFLDAERLMASGKLDQLVPGESENCPNHPILSKDCCSRCTQCEAGELLDVP